MTPPRRGQPRGRPARWAPITRLDVYYQDDADPRRVGGLVLARDGRIHFQYDRAWVDTGLELSPYGLPLAAGESVVPAPDLRKLHGLHGVFADALPDTWGMRVLSLALRRIGIDPARAGSLDRLACLGTRTMGALTFRPAAPFTDEAEHALTLDVLAAQAEMVDAGSVDDGAREGALDLFERAAGSAGGAQPKILVATSADGERMVGGADPPSGHTAYLVKFTPRQAGLGLRTDAGVLEEAYARMARAAGIDVPPTRLFTTSDGRQHFGVERFDRTATGGRRHVHTLGGLLGREAGDEGDYDEFFRIAFRLTADARARDEVLRRLYFNVLVLNDDDHLKNTAFRLEPTGEWRLAPAYDLTFTPSRRGERGMAIAGLEGEVTCAVIAALAARHGIKAARMHEIRQEVDRAVEDWPLHAEAAAVQATSVAELANAFASRRRLLDG